MQQPQSIPQQIRTRVLNMTLGQWMRAVDLVLSEYMPSGKSIDTEADRVAKLALLMMLTRWYDENEICILTDSTALRLPKGLEGTGRDRLEKILDRQPSDEFEITEFAHDDDAPPGHSGSSLSFPTTEDDQISP